MKLLVFLLLSASVCNGQNLKLSLPLKGEPGKDFFIDHYPDRDPARGAIDVYCGPKTYNGNKGTDFSISGFKKMDSGVYVYAAAEGIVLETKEDEYDRNKSGAEGGLGNYVAISHGGDIQTWYGQLKKSSVLVKAGNHVSEGQPIGMVGSSGFSSYPHLHFEVRTNEGTVIDPFKGNCSPRTYSLWGSEPKYDTSLFAIDAGFVPYTVPLDSLLEGYLASDTFYTNQDTVCFWTLVHGLRKGNMLRTEWYREGGLVKENSYKWKTNGWHDYTWSAIRMPEAPGKWTAMFYVNDKRLASRDFHVLKPTKRKR